MDENLAVDLVKRSSVFEVLSEGPTNRRRLERQLDASKTTVHRIVTRFQEAGLVTEEDGLALTELGRCVAAELAAFEGAVETAFRLEPLVSALDGTGITLDLSLLADATVTEASQQNPYRPINRLVSLIEGSSGLRGAYRIVPNPVFIDRLESSVKGSGRTEIVYERDAVREIAEQYPDRAASTLSAGNVRAYVTEGLPFGVSILDERAVLKAYDRSSGVLTLLVETENPDAVAWAEDVYERFRDGATRIDSLPDET